MDNITVPIPQPDSASKVEGSGCLGCLFGCLAFFLIGCCVFLFAGDLGFSFIKSWFTSEPFSLSQYFWDQYPDLLKIFGLMFALFGISLFQFRFTSSLGLWLIDLASAIIVVFVGVSVAASSAMFITMLKTSPLDYLSQMTNDISIGMRVGSYAGISVALFQLLLVSLLRAKELIPRDVTDRDYFMNMLPFYTLFILTAGVISGSVAGYERGGWLGVVLGIATGVLIPLVLFVKIINDKN